MAVTTVAFSNLNSWLQSQPANTASTPYELEITGLTTTDLGSSLTSGTLGYVIKNNSTKYVDLSATTLPNGISSMRQTFRECISLVTAPSIPSSVTNMVATFYECSSLTSAPAIPNGVTDIGAIFYYCYSLVSIPEIPDSVVSMSGAFSYCHLITSAPAIPSGVTDINSVFKYCIALTSAPAIPSGVTDMSYTFEGCYSLTYAPEIPDGVTNMNSTFAECRSLIYAPVLPNSVTNVNGTFSKCTLLEYKPIVPSSATGSPYFNVTTPNWKGTETQAEAFLSTFFAQTSDSELKVYNNDRVTYEYSYYNIDIDNLSTYLSTLGVNTVLTSYKIHIRNLTSDSQVISKIKLALIDNPSKYADLRHTEIPDGSSLVNLFCVQTEQYTYQGCLTLIYPPDFEDTTSLSADMTRAFYGCKNLKEAPNIRSATSNMTSTFEGCESLTTPPTLSTAGNLRTLDYTFKGSGITTPPSIPSGVTSMNSTFAECQSLSTAPTIPNTVTDLSYCFADTSITAGPSIPSSVTTIERCFYDCINLETAPSIPSNVTNMEYAFARCSDLTETPNIASGVQNMEGAFKDCTGLQTVKNVPSSVTNMENCFEGCTRLTVIEHFEVPTTTISSNPADFTDAFKDTALTKICMNASIEPSPDWKLWIMYIGASSVSGRIYSVGENGISYVTFSNISITKTDITFYGLTDGLMFVSSAPSDIYDVIEDMLESGYSWYGKPVLNPLNKNMVLWKDDNADLVTNLEFGADIEVYETLADAEADLANLEVGQFIATEQGGDGITDAVTDGDMRAITSNAVAQSKKHIIGETDTGGTWIDGKRIYRRVDTWSLASLPTGNSTYTFTSAYWSTIDTLIDFRIIRPRTATLLGAIITPSGYRFNTSTKELNVYNNATEWTGPFIIMCEYTKS